MHSKIPIDLIITKFAGARQKQLMTTYARKGVIIVPQKNSKEIEKLFTQHDIKHTKMKVWC
jgi:accessory colonization factor AcfC